MIVAAVCRNRSGDQTGTPAAAHALTTACR
jgi:hypothetical protein